MPVTMIGPKFYAFDPDTGLPLAGGKVYTKAAGTDTDKATFTTEVGDVENTNPVILNSAGYASIKLNGSYKIVVTDADDVEIWSEDPVSDASQLGLEWINQQDATQTSATTFTLIGNQTAQYISGRRIKMIDASDLYGSVSSSSYGGGLTTVAVNVDGGAALTAALVSAYVSILSGIGNSAGVDMTVTTVADLVLLSPELGQAVNTKSYYEPIAILANPYSGGGKYIAVAPRAFDGYSDHEAANGNIWVLQNDGVSIPEQYGAKGDDSTDDTASMRLVYNSGLSVELTADKTYITDYITVDSINNVTFQGNNAYLKRLETSTGADFIRGAVLALADCSNIDILSHQIDGNRLNLIATTPGNVSMNYGIAVYGSNTIGSDILLDNGGENKGSKNINIESCKFYRTGSTGVGTDTFGDGVFIYGADNVAVRHCYFEDMGRWAVAGGDVFNLTIANNRVDNAISGTLATALGSFDIENESGDQTNGTYSRGIRILGNKMVGRVSMTISTYDSANNDSGLYHYTKDIRVMNNEMECTQYAVNGVWGINVLISKRSTASPTMADLWIEDNVIKGDSATRMDFGLSIQGNVTTVTMENFHIASNDVRGFTDGIYIKSTSPPKYTNFTVKDNNVAAEFDSASGAGITINADDLDGVHVLHNKVRDYGAYGISCTKNAGSVNVAEVSNNFVFDGLATFTGTGIRASALTLVAKDNVVSQSGGVDYDLEATSVISNASVDLKYKIVELTGMTGATMQFTNAFPAGCICLGLSTRVTEQITGATSFDIGDGTDVDRWGNGRSVNVGITTDIQQFTISNPFYYTTVKSVVLTANGGNFTAGAVRIAVHYIELDPPKA